MTLKQQTKILEKIDDIISTRLLVRILDSLEGEKKEEFKKVMDSDDSEALYNYIMNKVPNFLDMVEEEFNNLKAKIT